MQKLINDLVDFRDERDWEDFHTSENLANSVHLEAGELAQLFQWGKTPEREQVADEIADTAIYLLYLCHRYGFDFKETIRGKIEKNRKKYEPGDHAGEYGWEK